MTLPTTDPKRADASALLALARAHPEHMTRDMKALVKDIVKAKAPKPVTRAATLPRRDWLLIPRERPIVVEAPPREMPTHKRIIALVTAVADVPIDDITRRSREPRATAARLVCMWLIRRHCLNASYTTIGKWLNRDHTSVLNGVRTVEAQFGRYAAVIEAVEREL